ncbi:MAG: phospholipid carrier-dependent glycosyltransferase [Actinobacteria bacterium]|nr:phospholipid carrier-dependent glycosyltransferase [Actinomycetota bacterium]
MIDRPRLLRVLVPAVLTGVAGILLFVRLDEPARIFFDEVYYVGDARQYLEVAAEREFAVHPPVGKWLIAAGIALLGDEPFGWRAVGALLGALSVLLTYLIGLRLFRRQGPAALAALLLAVDGLWIVQARTSMLDIHLAFFVVLGTWLLVVDRDASGLRDEPPDLPEEEERVLPRRSHPARALAGVAFGLAVATKWSGLLPLVAAIVLAVGWELAWRRRWTGRTRTGIVRGLAAVLVALVVLPGAVYLASYVPWLVNYEHSYEGAKECTEDDVVQDPCAVDPIGRLAGLWRFQRATLRFHLNLEATHTYRAPAYTWPVMARPIVYYYETCSEEREKGIATTNDEGEVEQPEPCVVERDEAAEIIALGNPALWWGFLLGLPLLAAGVARRDGRAWVVAAVWGAQFLPWLIVSRPAFFFYMVPVVPFLALGLAYAVVVLEERRSILATLSAAAVGAAVGFGAGMAGAEALDAETSSHRWILLGVGWALGGLLGGLLDHRRDRDVVLAERRRPGRRWTPGVVAGTTVAVLAVAMLVYFLPVWTGEPLPKELIRQRWWFDSWV